MSNQAISVVGGLKAMEYMLQGGSCLVRLFKDYIDAQYVCDQYEIQNDCLMKRSIGLSYDGEILSFKESPEDEEWFSCKEFDVANEKYELL